MILSIESCQGMEILQKLLETFQSKLMQKKYPESLPSRRKETMMMTLRTMRKLRTQKVIQSNQKSEQEGPTVAVAVPVSDGIDVR
jgi:hypothetical protein